MQAGGADYTLQGVVAPQQIISGRKKLHYTRPRSLPAASGRSAGARMGPALQSTPGQRPVDALFVYPRVGRRYVQDEQDSMQLMIRRRKQ
jgi:hypothetical protein